MLILCMFSLYYESKKISEKFNWKFQNAFDSSTFCLNYFRSADMNKTWWPCSPTWFENNSKGILCFNWSKNIWKINPKTCFSGFKWDCEALVNFWTPHQLQQEGTNLFIIYYYLKRTSAIHKKTTIRKSWTSEGKRGKTYQHGAAHIGRSTHCSCRWLQDFWYEDKSWNQPQALQLSALTINMTMNTVCHL